MRSLSASLAGGARHAVSRSGSSPVIPSTRARRAPPVPCPSSVEPSSWELLSTRLDDTQDGMAIANAALRSAVRAVVRELRVNAVSWEEVYTVLDSAVIATPDRDVRNPIEVELHVSRSASIVAHMHCWADVERLAELEEDPQAG